jgi:hypothetical protein
VFRRLKERNTECEDAERPGPPVVIIGDIPHKFLAKYHFASAKVKSRHFGMSPPTGMEGLSHELGFEKYALRWLLHLLGDTQQNH